MKRLDLDRARGERASVIDTMRKRVRASESEELVLKNVALSESRYDEANREYVVVAQTAMPDLDGDVVVPEGCTPERGGSMEYFLANGNIMWNHDYQGMAVAKLRNAPVLKRAGWYIRVRMMKHALAEDLHRMMAEGYAYPGASVGFRVLERRRPTVDEVRAYGEHQSIIPVWHWLETSLTFMPVNGECQVALDEPTEDAIALSLSKKTISVQTARRLGLPARRLWPAGPTRVLSLS